MNLIGSKIYFPIIFLLSWLCSTVLIFVFGPYDYKLNNPVIFYVFLIAVHIALFLGYQRGQKSAGRDVRNKFSYVKFVKWTIIIALIYLLVKIFLTSGGRLTNFNETFNDPSQVYGKQDSSLFSYLDMIFGPITIMAITNGIVSYKFFVKLYRYAIWVLVLFFIISAISSATRSGIVQIVIISLAAFSLGVYKKNIILKFYHKFLLFFVTILLGVLFLAYSVILSNERGSIIINNPLTNQPPKDDFFLNEIASPEMLVMVHSISFYVSHSYYNLNKALNMSFEGIGFGFSNSYFIMNNIEKITGWSGLKSLSYGVRLDNEYGIGGYGLYWSTFYTWIASDFTFPGVIIVVFFLGYLLSLSLKDSLYGSNPLSITVFCTLFFFIFHFAFNNPLQDGQGITTYLGLMIIWLVFRKNK